MRIAAVHASVEGDLARRALALALAQAPSRLFLFGAAASVAAAQVRREQAQQDERYLDLAARWLLDRGGGAPPTRAGLSVPLLEIGVAVGEGGEWSPLPSTDRAIELIGTQLCMAVPHRDRVRGEEWDNAALWILGGEDQPGLELCRDRPVVAPGDASAGAGPAIVDLGPAAAQVFFLDCSGNPGPTQSHNFTSGARISVQAGGGERR